MDRPDWSVGGVGYLPFKNRKLPARQTGNLNEALIIKCDDKLGMSDNQWPDAHMLPDFRGQVELYARHLEALGKRLLPVYARALGMDKGFFEEAFVDALYRLRLMHYLAVPPDEQGAYGIALHVDTSPFFFNANPNYLMHCVPSCFSDNNPAKYPAISYAQSQGVAQGE